MASKWQAEGLLELSQVELYVADVGPGSFSGIKVGVTMAKVWAGMFGKKVAAVQAFDLMGDEDQMQLGAGKGKAFLRIGDTIQVVASEGRTEPGYWPNCPNPIYPDTGRILLLLPRLYSVEPEQLAPLYGAEPSISQAKQTHIMGETYARDTD
ncbi:MAG: hypothetical protein MUC92_09290 [Fimbriimonadaceae bacterium]|jgi:hypothetical protein|nr:hypothetical protein [Fimbriimonadaceae bacterium]